MTSKHNLHGLIIICLKFLEILALTSTEELDSKVSIKLISGVYFEELPRPIFYDSYAPTVLKYQLPNWNKSEVTFNNWYSCITETVPFRYTCPVVYHMNKAILNLHIDFESIQPVKDFEPHDEFYSKLFENSEFCDTIQKHFSGIYIQNNELKKYIDTLEECHLKSGSTFIDNLLNNYNFSLRYPFTRIENNFYNTFYKAINASYDLVASATLSNARSTIQATLLSVYYAEKNRWTHAVQDCRSQVIPHSVVTYAKFNETVLQFATAFSTPGSIQELSIPLELISKYYNLPLTDCTFTEDSFITRILIPIRNKSTKILNKKLYKLNPIPFQYKNKLCQVQLNHEMDEKYMYDEETRLAYKINCLPNELCQITNAFMSHKIDPCATALFSYNFEEFVKSCSFHCYDRLGDSQKLIIIRVKSNKYIFVGKAEGVLNDMGRQVPTERNVTITGMDEEYFGAVEVTLPCKNKLTVGDTILYSEKPCEDDNFYSIVNVAPWHISRDIDDKTFDKNLLELFTNDEKTLPYHEEISAGINVTKQKNEGSSSQTFIWIFFSFVSIILFSLQFFVLYQISKLQGWSRHSIQNMFYKARETDDEPEFRLINE